MRACPRIDSLTRRRRGAALVFVTVMLFVMFAFATLAVDVGYICAMTAEQQNTADAGSLAGAWMLQGSKSEDLDEWVRELIGKNQKAQGYQSLDDQVVEVGKWYSTTHTFSALPPEDWAKGAFAVRVRAYRNKARLFFASILGKTHTNVSREAVAVGSRGCRGIWGLEGVRVQGNMATDSFNSDVGLYDEDTALENGDVCSGRAIDGMGSFEIRGDAMTGFGYGFEISGAAYELTGLTTASIGGVQAPPAEMGETPYENDNDQIRIAGRARSVLNLNIRSHTRVTLDPGTYYFESITINAEASIRISGPTNIYVSGNITDLGKGFVNTTLDPSNLTIVCSGSQVLLNGGAEFYGQLLAPNAEVTLSGTSDYFGAAIGKFVWMKGDFEFHVDESSPMLDLLDTPPAPMLVR